MNDRPFDDPFIEQPAHSRERVRFKMANSYIVSARLQQGTCAILKDEVQRAGTRACRNILSLRWQCLCLLTNLSLSLRGLT
jgi:hypothetical protein